MGIFAFLMGLAMLVIGAELLVRGASRLAEALGIAPLIVGLTVVSFATSAPELAISLQATWAGTPDLAIGNVVGSNVANVLLILGLAALLRPLPVDQALVRVDVPIMVALSGLAWLLALNGRLEPAEGALLLLAGATYTVVIIRAAQRLGANARAAYEETYEPPPTPRAASDLLRVGAGVMLLTGGAHAFMIGAESLAQSLGISPLVIGLTLSAVGTSLPEIATSVLASYRGAGAIAIGNVVGSNIMNLAGVLGLTACLMPEGVPVAASALDLGFPTMTFVAAICLPIFFIGKQVARWEGAFLVAAYGLFIAVIAQDATGARWAPALDALLGGLVLQIVAGLLLLMSVHEAWLRHRRPPPPPPDQGA